MSRMRAWYAAIACVLVIGWSSLLRAAAGQPGQPTGDFQHTPAAGQRTDTPLPVYLDYHGGQTLVRVVIKYKTEQMAKWRLLELQRVGQGWGGQIPCADVTAGTMKYWAAGFDENGDPVAISGNIRRPFTVPIDDGISEAPHLPGKAPPRRCHAAVQDETATSDESTEDQGEGAQKKNKPKANKYAEGESDNEKNKEKDEETDFVLEDTTRKHASIEIAGYTDSDHINVFTPSVNLGVDNTNGASLSATYLVDVVSAASVDIVSTASQRWQEIRQAGTVSGQYKPHDFGVGLGGSVSSEPDYLSYGGYATALKDFNEKNWTLTVGYGFSHDTIGRCGDNGICTPSSVFSRQLDRGTFNGGVAWVVDSSTLASLSLDVIIENGDQSKPYRYIPMFSPAVAPNVANGASIDWVNANRLAERPLEQLPLERRRSALTGRYARRLDGSTLRLEERLYDDDWGLVASTTDARWIFDLGQRFALWPHVRFHGQSSVVFWQKAYESRSSAGWDLPEFRTGDRELGPLLTLGAGVGFRLYLGSKGRPEQWQMQLTWDGMYTSFLDDLYVTDRTAMLGAFTFTGEL
jgi:hypothetical protein